MNVNASDLVPATAHTVNERQYASMPKDPFIALPDDREKASAADTFDARRPIDEDSIFGGHPLIEEETQRDATYMTTRAKRQIEGISDRESTPSPSRKDHKKSGQIRLENLKQIENKYLKKDFSGKKVSPIKSKPLPFRETWNMPYTEPGIVAEETPAKQAVNEKLKKNLEKNQDKAKLKQLQVEMKLDKHKNEGKPTKFWGPTNAWASIASGSDKEKSSNKDFMEQNLWNSLTKMKG